MTRLGQRNYRYVRLTPASLGELHPALNKGKERVIAANTHVLTRIVHGSTLTYNDATRLSQLPTKQLHAEAFTVRVATVTRTTDTIHMRHNSTRK